MIELADTNTQGANIKVVGVGGGGGNALNNMIEEELEGVEFIAANTDLQALHQNLSPMKIQLGEKVTRGLGAGANPDMGRKAAMEDQQRISEMLEGADMVFITAGMGGGTGTGAAPVIANVAREAGALTVAIVTRPFTFEGKKRMGFADSGLDELRKSVDTLIVIPNDKLLALAPPGQPMKETFKLCDSVLVNAVRGISDLILVPGLINVDFADVRTVMTEKGRALMSTGTANGESRAREAAEAAVQSPLLEEKSLRGARGMLINITGPTDLSLHEVNEAVGVITEMADEDCNIIFGSVVNPDLDDTVKVTVIATGFDGVPQVARPSLMEEQRDWHQPSRAQAPSRPTHHQQDYVLSNAPTRARQQQQYAGASAPPPIPSGSTVGQMPFNPHPTGYDQPAFQRSQQQAPQPEAHYEHTDQSELDVPAYQRNQDKRARPVSKGWGIFDKKRD